jgi:hypothetical protein
MLETLIQVVAIFGFACLWLGLALLMLSVFLSLFLNSGYWNSLSLPFRDRFTKQGEVLNHAFQTAGKSRLNRMGQFLGAIGLSLLLLTGLLWLALRIAQGPNA